MGLSINVGMLADLLENDVEGADWFREAMDDVNVVLAENGLGPHVEPETLPALDNRSSIDGFPYSFLHYLRRVAAHVAESPGWIATPFPESSSPTDDPLVIQQLGNMESHLLCHSDCVGYYLPIPFTEVIFDDAERIPGGLLGSSFQLMKELVAIAPALDIRLKDGTLEDDEVERINDQVEAECPLWIEKMVWLLLIESARLSIQHKTAICFG